MIAILDYGAGNLRSVQNTLDELGAQYQLVSSAEGLCKASKVLLPGVGHFGQMMRALDALGVRQALKDQIGAGVPFFGICLGLHALFERSAEAEEAEGLGIYRGEVLRFAEDAKVPHMGWNTLQTDKNVQLLKGLDPEPHMYFAHSYYVPVCAQTAATCTYTLPYTAVLESANVFGVQFHPEKSGLAGLQIVRNFLELPC
jgi:glutamine amidotransferase